MRIKSLWISEYKNLKEFTIEFDTSSPLNIIIGNNGNGKSNLLEALSLIFNDIFLIQNLFEKVRAEDKDFQKENRNTLFLDYLKNLSFDEFDYKIRFIENDKEKLIEFSNICKNYTFKENGTDVSFGDIQHLIPKNLFGYYSGSTSHLEKNFRDYLKHEEKFDDIMNMIDKENLEISTIEKKQYTFPKMFYYNESILGIVILTIYYSKFLHPEKYFIENIFKFGPIQEFKLRFKKFKSLSIDIDYNEFYYKELEGTQRQLLEIASETGLVNSTDGGRFISSILLENADFENFFSQLENSYFSPKILFESLVGLVKNESMPSYLDLQFLINNSKNKISFRALSEGEKQYLLNTFMLYIYEDTPLILLLDEPDTYLHPKWQRELIKFITSLSGKYQIIFTTHSPNSLSLVPNQSIKLISNGKIINERHYSYGRDSASVLYEYFDMEPIPIEDHINEINLINKLIDEGKFEDAKNRIGELSLSRGDNDVEIIKLQTSLFLERNIAE